MDRPTDLVNCYHNGIGFLEQKNEPYDFIEDEFHIKVAISMDLISPSSKSNTQLYYS